MLAEFGLQGSRTCLEDFSSALACLCTSWRCFQGIGDGWYNSGAGALSADAVVHHCFQVELIGFEGNRDKAVSLLEAAAADTSRSPRCTFHAAVLRLNLHSVATWAKSLVVGTRFFLYDEQDAALQLLTSLLEEYPYVRVGR